MSGPKNLNQSKWGPKSMVLHWTKKITFSKSSHFSDAKVGQEIWEDFFLPSKLIGVEIVPDKKHLGELGKKKEVACW